MQPTNTVDPSLLFTALHAAYLRDDILALLQAIRFAKMEGIAMPAWTIEPYEAILTDILKGTPGKLGRGNLPFGKLKKGYLRTVRASAYLYVRAWQSDPHRYADMPRKTILRWYHQEINWPSAGYLEAARQANDALKGTKYQAHSTTIRKAANGMVAPIRWGRWEVEESLCLRGDDGIFGAPPGRPPAHVAKVLMQHPPIAV